MNNRGFTLVELLSVIVIMGIMLVVAIPGVFGVSKNIKDRAFCKKVSDIESAAKLYGQDFVDDIEEKGYIQIDVKTLIDNNMYRKEVEGCEMGSETNPCVIDPRNDSAMDKDKITIIKKEKRFSAYYNFKGDDIDLCEGKLADDQFGEYKVTLNNNDATYAEKDYIIVKFGTIPDPITPPKKEFVVNLKSDSYEKTEIVRFTFRGYFLNNDRDTMYFDQTGKAVRYYTRTTDTVLFAAWDTNSFVLPTLTKTGYEFIGWWDKATGGNKVGNAGMKYTPKENNQTIYGHWAPKTTEVTLDHQGAYYPSTSVVTTATYNANMPAISKPKRTYTITYNYNGNGQANSTATPEATFEGYWTQKVSGGKQYYNASAASANVWKEVAETATLYARWGTATVTLPTPSPKDGYEFDGWYTKASGGNKVGNAGAKYSIKANTTIYAHWKTKGYTIKFNNEEANYAGTRTVTATYQSKVPSITIPQKTYTVTFDYNGGYGTSSLQAPLTFKGYYTGRNGTGTQYYNESGTGLVNYTLTSGVDLYAYWVPTSIRLPRAYHLNYYTTGFWTAKSGGTKVGTEGYYFTPKSNTTLYAQWSSVNVHVTVHYFARSYSDSAIFTYTNHSNGQQVYVGPNSAADLPLTFNVKSGTRFVMTTRNGTATELYSPGFKAGSVGEKAWDFIGTDTFYFIVPNRDISIDWYWSESQLWNTNRRYVPCSNCNNEIVLSK